MCDPSATAGAAGAAGSASEMGKIGLYASIASGFSNTLGSVTNSINTRRTADLNAGLADQQASDALARGQDAEFKSRLRTAQLKGTQTATLAAHGVALDQGSALDILTSTDVMGAADAATIHDNAAKESWGYKVQASNYRSQAANANPWAAGGASLLGSAASVADRWYKYNKQTGYASDYAGKLS
jgi:hypothetical protein